MWERIKLFVSKNNYENIDFFRFIKRNYDDLINQFIRDDSFIDLVYELYSNYEMKKFLDNRFISNFIVIISNLDIYNEEDYKMLLSIYSMNKSPLEFKKFLHSKFEDLIKITPASILWVLQEYKDLDIMVYNKLNNKINSNKREYLEGILSKRVFTNIHFIDNKYLGDLYDVFIKVFEELLENQNLNLVDISYPEFGASTAAFIVGDKVLKIGSKRITYKIPYHPRILQPLIRVNLENFIPRSTTDLLPVVIEVSEKVDTNCYISEDEIYEVYKELRNDGIIWTDVSFENVGRLLKENKRWYNKNLAYNIEALGIENTGNINYEELNEGEIVICDTDFLYKEDDFNIIFASELAKKFENKYINELNENKNIK